MKADPIVDEVRRVREELVKKYGGLDGWIDHLQELEKARAHQTKKRVGKSAEAVTVRKQKSRRLPVGPA